MAFLTDPWTPLGEESAIEDPDSARICWGIEESYFKNRCAFREHTRGSAMNAARSMKTFVSGVGLVLLLSALSVPTTAQHLPDRVGKVDLTRPVSIMFFRKDATYAPNGDILIRKGIVWNTATDVDGIRPVGVVVGELPPVPAGIPEPDTSQPMQTVMNSLKCKPRSDGRIECNDMKLRPTAIRAQR